MSVFSDFSLLSVINLIIKTPLLKKQMMMGVYQFGAYLDVIFNKRKWGETWYKIWKNK